MQVRSISREQHLGFIASQSSVSFLQTPAWGQVKSEWRSESIGFFDNHDQEGDRLIGAALVLYRQMPKLKRYLAYLPEGPALPWAEVDVAAALDALASYLKGKKAFAIRIGPPVVTARWDAATIKQGLASPEVAKLSQLPPTETPELGARVREALATSGWKSLATESGFAAGQPQFNFVIRLRHHDGTALTEAEVLAKMNQLWRRNIKRAAKVGVTVRRTSGTQAEQAADLAAFHDLYRHTAERDHFTPRPASYFTTMQQALRAEAPERFELYLAEHEGDLVAATIAIRVGDHCWYSYGASSTEKREVRGSNAVQWQMIQDAMAAGCATYDLRGITETLDSDDPHVGLINFKVGTGGDAVAYVGEWDLPLSAPLYAAFEFYLKRRR